MRRPAHSDTGKTRAGSWRAAIVAAAISAVLTLSGTASASALKADAGIRPQASISSCTAAPESHARGTPVSRFMAEASLCQGERQLDQDERRERITCMIHERRRDDARCAVELLGKAAYPIAIIMVSASGLPHDVLDALRTIAAR